MSINATFSEKSVTIDLTASAQRALQERSSPLCMEMELYFSCLIRKALRIREEIDDRAVKVADNLYISFRPVMSEICEVKPGVEPPLTDFPITNIKPYIPHWVRLDFNNGVWRGDFGYADSAR